jgi:hypothetical protein
MIRDPKRQAMGEFDDLLGLDRLKPSLNDSKRELGSRVDRHEHIGQGKIGAEAFRFVLRDKRLSRVPMYLETPKGDHAGETWDTINLRRAPGGGGGRGSRVRFPGFRGRPKTCAGVSPAHRLTRAQADAVVPCKC